MNGILIVIALIVVTCTLIHHKRGRQPRVLFTLSLIFVVTLILAFLGPVMRHHPVASMLVSLGASYGLYFFYKYRTNRFE